MVEEKKSAKISLAVAILLIIIITIMAFYIYLEKTKSNNELARLGNNLKSVQETLNTLKETSNNSVDTKNLSSETVSEETTEKAIKIEGKYNMVSTEATDGVDYTFKENHIVECNSNNTEIGLYEITDNKITMTYFLFEDVETKQLSLCDFEPTITLTIVDENTLMDNSGIKYVKR